MAKEIERKFLVKDDSYKAIADSSHHIVQGYISLDPDATVRVRIRDNEAFLTVKTRNDGACRNEWEYRIPLTDAEEMLEKTAFSGVIDKTRYNVGRWEIDEFHGNLSGLTIAEIELQSETEDFVKPEYIGREVTEDNRYYNSALIQTLRIPPVH